MNRSIINPRVHLLLQEKDTAFNLMLGAAADESDEQSAGKSRTSRSALQNPEIRRLELAAMLRQALKKQQSQKSQRTYWAAFLASYVRGNANSNDLSE